MNHSFNVRLAEKVGIEEAILIENLAFWIKKNVANNKNFIDGEYWSYNSASAFQELFPYMNLKKIQRSLKKLEEAKIIKSGIYNTAKYDRTKWYCIIDKDIKKMYEIHYNTDKHSLDKMTNGKDDMTNGKVENVQPIPDINTDINTDKKIDKKIDKINQSTLEDDKVKFRKNLREYINIVSKSTGLDVFRIENVITPSLFKDIEISEVLKKIKESDYLQGLKEDKPKIGNFTTKNMINRILVDSYKNKNTAKSKPAPYQKQDKEVKLMSEDIFNDLYETYKEYGFINFISEVQKKQFLKTCEVKGIDFR